MKNEWVIPPYLEDVNLSIDNRNYELDYIEDEKVNTNDSEHFKTGLKMMFTLKNVNEKHNHLIINGKYNDSNFIIKYYNSTNKDYKLPDNFYRNTKNSNGNYLLIAAKHNGKWGYITDGATWIIEPQYEEACAFAQDWHNMPYANVKKDGKWGVIDLNNNIIKPFKKTNPIQNRVFRISEKAKKKENDLFQNTESKFILARKENKTFDVDLNINFNNYVNMYDNYIDNQDGIIITIKNQKYGIFTKDHGEVIPCIFDYIDLFERKDYTYAHLGDTIITITKQGYFDWEAKQFPITNTDISNIDSYINFLSTVNPYNIAAICHSGQLAMKKKDYKLAMDLYQKAKELANKRTDITKYLYSTNYVKGYADSYYYHTGYYSEQTESSESILDIFSNIINSGVQLQQNIQNYKNNNYSNIETNNTSESGQMQTKTKKLSKSDNNGVWMAGNYATLKNVYSNYESQIIKMQTYPETYNESQCKNIQSKMKRIRENIISHGGTCAQSQTETWRP